MLASTYIPVETIGTFGPRDSTGRDGSTVDHGGSRGRGWVRDRGDFRTKGGEERLSFCVDIGRDIQGHQTLGIATS